MMNLIHDAIDRAILGLDQLRRNLKKNKTRQVNFEERSIIKAVAMTWFHNYRPVLNKDLAIESLVTLDDQYRLILLLADKASSREKCDRLIKVVKVLLSKIRGDAVMLQRVSDKSQTTDNPPQFSPLITDSLMQDVLKRRWVECCKCLSVRASLASVVMMGGLLEALLLARVHREPSKSLIFNAKLAPIDSKTRKTLSLPEWTLKHYIDVAHELKWISQSAKDISIVLRDYRNYIHPYKELSHGVILGDEDAKLLWEVSKNITRQVIKST